MVVFIAKITEVEANATRVAWENSLTDDCEKLQKRLRESSLENLKYFNAKAFRETLRLLSSLFLKSF